MRLARLLRAFAAVSLLALAAPGCTDGAEIGDEQNVTATTARFETFVGDDGLHYFQLLAANGEELVRSDGYKTKASAKTGMGSLQTASATRARFTIEPTDSGESYFTVHASNGKLLALSGTYKTQASAEKGIDAVMRVAKTASGVSAPTGEPVFETFKGQDGKYYFHLRANNGQIVLASQAYGTKSAATKGIASVKKNGIDASRFTLAEGADGQHYFRLRAANEEIIGRSEMYKTKSGAMAAAAAVRELLRDVTDAGEITDATIGSEIASASEGLLYTSESDFPYELVTAKLTAGQEIDEALVRSALASYVDGDEAADKPMADLVAMTQTWEEWKNAEHGCSDLSDPFVVEQCQKQRALEQVLESNLSDVQVYYFGAHGSPGDVQGIGVSILIVGRAPSGNLVGVRTVAIWT
jgi:hypothetical protein